MFSSKEEEACRIVRKYGKPDVVNLRYKNGKFHYTNDRGNTYSFRQVDGDHFTVHPFWGIHINFNKALKANTGIETHVINLVFKIEGKEFFKKLKKVAKGFTLGLPEMKMPKSLKGINKSEKNILQELVEQLRLCSNVHSVRTYENFILWSSEGFDYRLNNRMINGVYWYCDNIMVEAYNDGALFADGEPARTSRVTFKCSFQLGFKIYHLLEELKKMGYNISKKQKKEEEIKRTQEAYKQSVQNRQKQKEEEVVAKEEAKEASIEEEVSERYDSLKEELLAKMKAARMEKAKDRSLAHEYHKKSKELEEREKELELTKREQEIAMLLREKDIEVAQKLLEVTKLANAASHDKAMGEVILRMIEVEKTGLANRHELLEIERKLLDIQNEGFEFKAREILMGIREKQMTLTQSKMSIDRQKLLLDRAKATANDELESKYRSIIGQVHRNIGWVGGLEDYLRP